MNLVRHDIESTPFETKSRYCIFPCGTSGPSVLNSRAELIQPAELNGTALKPPPLGTPPWLLLSG